jgi:hypothetical protein
LRCWRIEDRTDRKYLHSSAFISDRQGANADSCLLQNSDAAKFKRLGEDRQMSQQQRKLPFDGSSRSRLGNVFAFKALVWAD